MSIFDHTLLRPFYRLIKTYADDLLRTKEEDVEDRVDKIDSRLPRSKLLRREWQKEVKKIKEWNASKIKKEVQLLVRRAQGHRHLGSHGSSQGASRSSQASDDTLETLEDMLNLARYSYLKQINAEVDVNVVDIGPPSLETFLTYFLARLMQDDMVTSRQFLNSSVSDRRAVVRSCMTDAIEESIPHSVHREILARKSRRRKHHKQKQEEDEQEGTPTQRSATTDTTDTQAEQSEQSEQSAMAPPSNKTNDQKDHGQEATSEKPKKPKKPKKRRVKEVRISLDNEDNEDEYDQDEAQDDDQDDHNGHGHHDTKSQMQALEKRLQYLRTRAANRRPVNYHDDDFELSTNLSEFM